MRTIFSSCSLLLFLTLASILLLLLLSLHQSPRASIHTIYIPFLQQAITPSSISLPPLSSQESFLLEEENKRKKLKKAWLGSSLHWDHFSSKIGKRKRVGIRIDQTQKGYPPHVGDLSLAPATSPSSALAPSPYANLQHPAFGNRQEPAYANLQHPAKLNIWGFGISCGVILGGITAFVGTIGVGRFVSWIRIRRKVGLMIFSKELSPKQLLILKKGLENAQMIGQGGSGDVFKLHLQNGVVVAIKCVYPHHPEVSDPLTHSYDLTRQTKQIKAEINTLGLIRHRNLVPLLAYVCRIDSHLLVYTYMVNGSLREALQRVAEGSVELSWPVRLRIALGTAEGLAYLHFHCEPRILHRDLKPANILLDEAWEAHLGDFGLARLLPDSHSHYSSSNVAGTLGYIAPEYHQTCRFNDKADVYSFGVVLTVLLTGRELSDELFSGVIGHMGNWLHDCYLSGMLLKTSIHPSLVKASKTSSFSFGKLLSSALPIRPLIAPIAKKSSPCSTRSAHPALLASQLNRNGRDTSQLKSQINRYSEIHN